MLVTQRQQPLMLRLAAPLAWRNPERIAAKLHGFAATELGSARDMMLAAEETRDAKLRRLFLRHALDEHRHSKMFAAAAQKVSGGIRVRRYEAHHAEPQSLLQKWGVMRFVAFIHISESRAAAQFEVLAAHFSASQDEGHADLGRLFEAVLADEKFHCRYSEHLLQQWRDQGHEREVAKAIASVKRSLLWMAWRRSGRRIGDLLVSALMLTLYATVVPLFALVARVAERGDGAGWRVASRADNTHSLDDARRPF